MMHNYFIIIVCLGRGAFEEGKYCIIRVCRSFSFVDHLRLYSRGLLVRATFTLSMTISTCIYTYVNYYAIYVGNKRLHARVRKGSGIVTNESK